MTVKIDFPYVDFPPVFIPEEQLIDIIQPKVNFNPRITDSELIRMGLEQPIGSSNLRNLVQKDQKILILVDDYTRITPTRIILPLLMKELSAGGVSLKDIKLLIASGTHRAMSVKEKELKYGKDIVDSYKIIDHKWCDSNNLIQLSTALSGIDVWINKEVLTVDFIVGIGQIVPHRVAGFSGGAKIIQPGICGPITTGQTHWESALYDSIEIMGKADNPIRRSIDEIGKCVGLKFIINIIHDGSGRIFKCVCGDPIKAYNVGCKVALDIYGIPLSEPADIVIVDSFPADVELWQAAKGIFSADLALKQGGVMVLISPCLKGVSVEYPEITDIGYKSFVEVKAMVKRGEVKDLTLAAHLAHVGRIIRDKGIGILVSSGIDGDTTKRLGFHYSKTPQEGFELALKLKGKDAKVVVIKNGGEVMPIIRPIIGMGHNAIVRRDFKFCK